MQLNNQLSNSFVTMEYADSDIEPTAGYEELYNTAYRDYQTLNISDVEDFCNANPNALLNVNVQPGMSPELIANKLYNDKDYWDLLMVLNNREALDGLPKSNDLLEAEVEALVNEYFANYQGNASDELIAAYKSALLARKQLENEAKQTFVALNPQYKKQFLRSVKYSV